MKKTNWFTLALAMALLLPVLAMAEGELSQPASAGRSAAALQSPIVGPLLDIWSDAIDNQEPLVAYNILHNEYLVVWWNEQGPNTWDVYARRVGSDGSLRSWFAVATGPGQRRWEPAVAYSPVQDEYLIVYTYQSSGDDYDLYAKRVKWDGTWMSSEFVVKDDAGFQYEPAVTYNSQDDEYLVVYENWWLGAGLRDIAAQRLRGSDGFLLSWANVATGAGEQRTSPDVAYNEARNQYLIAYDYYDYSSGREDIHGKVAVASLAGVSVSPEINISDTTNSSYIWEGVAAGPDEYLVVWREHLGPMITNVYGRRVSGDGALLGSAGGFPIATGTFDGFDTFDPMAVAYGAGCGYLVTSTYTNSQSWWEADVYGRYVMPGQDEATGEEFLIDDSPNAQVPWGVACAPSGDCLVVEEHNALSHPGENWEIRGRFVMPHRVYLPLSLKNYGP